VNLRQDEPNKLSTDFRACTMTICLLCDKSMTITAKIK
jgi:hypothetical protein